MHMHRTWWNAAALTHPREEEKDATRTHSSQKLFLGKVDGFLQTRTMWQLCGLVTECQNSGFSRCFHSTPTPWVTWDCSGFTSSRNRFIHAELGEQGGQQIAVLRGVASPGNILHEDILGSDLSPQVVATLIFYFTDVNFRILDRFFKGLPWTL